MPAVKLLLSTGSVEANSDVTLKALALYGENSEMHELLFAHAERSQRQTEKAQMRFNIMWQMVRCLVSWDQTHRSASTDTI